MQEAVLSLECRSQSQSMCQLSWRSDRVTKMRQETGSGALVCATPAAVLAAQLAFVLVCQDNSLSNLFASLDR